jgi:predicted DNA binding CopG/RHH family protein
MTTHPSKFKKVTIRLEERQVQSLRKMYPDVPYNKIIRAVIDKQIKLHEEKMAKYLAQGADYDPVA